MPAYFARLPGALGGHYWTLRPFAFGRHGVTTSAGRGAVGLPSATPWTAQVDDERYGSLRLTGVLHGVEGARVILVLVHGLGGNATSTYLSRARAQAAACGWASLSVSLRGADGSGEGFYHAGLTADLHAALGSAALASFTDIYVMGYSLGGHCALRLASEAHDRRVRAVAAVCAPIDLARSAVAIDRPGCWPYRSYVLRRLKQCYAAIEGRHALPTPVRSVRAVRSLREWDACTVVPFYGFASTSDYHASASAAGRLTALRVPALLIATEHDPMVPATAVRPALPAAAQHLDVRWLRRGGHVGFPPDTDLGEPVPLGLERQVLSWLERAGKG